MGRPKALLPHTNPATSFVEHAIRTCRDAGADHVIVVGRPDDGALRDEVARHGALLVTNDDPDRGQLSSLVTAVDAAEREFDAEGVLALPVDVPLVTPAAIRCLLDRAGESDAPILRATSGGRHGHPVIFKRAVFEELRSADPALGAKAVVRADPARVMDVDVGEPGSLAGRGYAGRLSPRVRPFGLISSERCIRGMTTT